MSALLILLEHISDLSPFIYNAKKAQCVFKPLLAAAHTFATPIQQIITSSFPSDGQRQSKTLFKILSMLLANFFLYKIPIWEFVPTA